MSDENHSVRQIIPEGCPIKFNLAILSKADLQSIKKAENGTRSPPNLNNDFLGNQQTASTEARASPSNCEQFDGVTIDVQAQMVDAKARDAPNSNAVQVKPPPLEVMCFVNPPQRIQNGECPILLLNGARAPDRSMLNVTPNEVETKEYGQYSILQGSNSGQIYETSLSLLNSNEELTSAEFYHHLGGKYYESETEYLYLNGKGDYITMTDFLVKVESRVIEKDTDGTKKDYISFKMYDADGWEQTEKILYDKWSSLFTFIKSKAADRLIATDEVALQRFEALATLILRNSKITVKVVLNYWGWGELQSDGSRRFYHGGLSDCNSDKVLPPAIINYEERRKVLGIALRITAIGQREIISVLLIYAVASYLDAVFTDAGHLESQQLVSEK